MSTMRTTLTLDDDLAQSLKERARLLDLPFKQVVNDTLRRGLSPSSSDAAPTPYRVVPNASGLVPGVDPLKLNQVHDQLEAATFSRKQRG